MMAMGTTGLPSLSDKSCDATLYGSSHSNGNSSLKSHCNLRTTCMHVCMSDI